MFTLPFGKIAAHSAYDLFSWYKYLIVNLVFPTSVFWSGNLFLIAPFPDRCLLVPFHVPPPNHIILQYPQFALITMENKILTFEPHREKTGFLPRRKQRRKSASR